MDTEIIQFISEQKVATIACVDGDAPYCFNCYYSFLKEEGLLIYKSSLNTRHEEILVRNRLVAGTILPDEISLTTLRGLQFEGRLPEASWDLTMKASSSYYLRFPFAMSVPGQLRCIEIWSAKLTDNTKGFGHKQIWKRQ